MNTQLVSVVCPVYNQADHIQSVLEEFIAALDRSGLAYELLPVINGPRRDRSLEICRSLESKFPRIRTLAIDGEGWGRAVRHGLAQAKGDLLCYTNSARTTGADLLLAVLYGAVHPECVIKANRKIRSGPWRRLGSLIYNLECRALFDLPYWDINGTPKVFSRSLSALLSLTRDDDLIDLEFNAICRGAGYPMIEIPILSSSRRSGKSTTTWKSAASLYWGAWRLCREFAAR